jgi:hypothetical protein
MYISSLHQKFIRMAPGFRSLPKIVILMFGILLSSRSVFGSEATTVYFFPFEIDTYVPITKATIQSSASQKWTISNESEVARLLAILNRGVKAHFDDANVRAVVFSGGQTYYLNRDGVIQKGDQSYKIDLSEFWKFRASLSESEMHTAP